MRRLSMIAALATLGAGFSPEMAAAQAGRQEAQRGQPVRLAPHQAVYDFTLGTTRTEKGITALSGRLVYELRGSACEGYTQTTRLVTRTSTASGSNSVTDQRSTTWEDDTGMRFRFQTSVYRDQKLIERTAGTATRGEGEEDTRLELTDPKPGKTAIGARAMFPVQHSIALLDAARRGRSVFMADFFDGSEGGEKTYAVSAQIGKAVGAGFNRSLPKAGQSEKLDGVAAWPVMLSYFEQGSEKTDALPAYEMGFVFFANGVSRRLVVDNGEYTMKGELADLKMLDPTPCQR